LAVTAVKPERSALAVKAFTIGGAAASCCVIGCRPSSSSTVRIVEEHELLRQGGRVVGQHHRNRGLAARLGYCIRANPLKSNG
jgi:hypothetical protein